MHDAMRAPSRRSFLQSLSAAAALAGAGAGEAGSDTSVADDFAEAEAALDDANAGMLIIDCHAHPYSDDTQKYPPVAKKPFLNAPPKGIGTVAQLRRDSQTAGVRFVIGVQPRTYFLYDNRFTVEAARTNRDWLIGAVDVDPDDPHSPDLFEQYVRDGNVRGLVSVPAKSGRYDEPINNRLWEGAQKLGITINVNSRFGKVKDVETMIRRFPKVRVALDHSLNMEAGPNMKRLMDDLMRLATYPNVYTKLSFLPTGSAEPYPFRDLHEPCRQIIRAFGPDRCVWGSNFPCELWCPNVTYAQHLRLITHELGLDQATKETILGKTPKALWFNS
jgi:predicted TIM-barrel fold metal-dependent hydrolase